MKKQQAKIGMIGLGVMGRNLVLNMADHGFVVAGYDKDAEKVAALSAEAGERAVMAAATLADFLHALEAPRTMMLLVPAGAAVEAVIEELTPHFRPGDLLIDGGNSYFKDTAARGENLARRGVHFLGVGISGGEQGARHGPSLMPGGAKEAYARVQPIFEAVAARVGDAPCVAYLGPGAAGHYVKMVHNGIEYGLMQLIAEAYDFMRRGLGLDNAAMQHIFHAWNAGELQSFLLEITAEIFRRRDPQSGGPLLDVILDVARQKGTGKWTSQDAMDLQVPVPTIDAAVAARDLSMFKKERVAMAKQFPSEPNSFGGDVEKTAERLGNALYFGMIATYTQGMALLRAASTTYAFGLRLEEVARIWRGGCIIRAALLEPIRRAFHAEPALTNLLLDPQVGAALAQREGDLRFVVQTAASLRIPLPALMASLAYFDGFRSASLPANLIQAQRDYFGAHTYERLDRAGTFHTPWGEKQEPPGQ